MEALHHAAVELASEARWQEAGIAEVPVPFVAELGDHAVVVEVHVFINAATRGSLEKALRERLVAAAATSDVMLAHEQFAVWLQTEEPSVAGS